MEDKREAKQLIEKSGVPVVPGYQDAFQDLNILQEEAISIGFPLLIKAAAGGEGGNAFSDQ
ncbi:hypothetical protein B1F79_02435 [Coxiella-like endosymbiont of Rhipicephalus sanguineus]|uniref:ATP-binding protein n=1 Tax=Coxiella-like endosymbiont of Rhipicephalus sanguineus TaxID=1955402 RepID=UPI00203B50E6|nr:hypothetical protein [Coxiella-like endosymbiont of Rhipicephalus sanguineus]MBT8506481.1 hypothetical protein [Coxiella-like endosymbiont of Rhipicephalus sanguineus]